MKQFTVEGDDVGQTLAALARRHALADSWSAAKRLAERGKLFVDGECVTDPAHRPRGGARVELRAAARVPVPPAPGEIVYEDSQLVVLDKPSGVSSVPYEARETGTAMDLVRAHWKRAGRRATDTPLHVVHRIDKETSGLLCFARSKTAERALQALFRSHDVERSYRCVVHGALGDRRIESMLVEDRGDGLRGSTRAPGRGKRAVTHVRAVGAVGGRATECLVRLETGKTHQIRIHLAENGHPIVGERVYIRDFTARGGEPLPSPRLLLHAETLGFVHPLTGERLRWERPPPPDFRAAVAALRRIR